MIEYPSTWTWPRGQKYMDGTRNPKTKISIMVNISNSVMKTNHKKQIQRQGSNNNLLSSVSQDIEIYVYYK